MLLVDALTMLKVDSYVKYLRDTIKDALGRIGNVFEFTNDKIKIQIDLNDFGFPRR
jgi:hypothetical protein